MYRIEVYEGPVQIWSSSFGKSFTQNITKVEPDKIGETVVYQSFWDGTENNGKAAPTGTLTVVATIPAKPKPYVVRKEFNWTGR
jgi:flagellar hook assembly protein FlgD